MGIFTVCLLALSAVLAVLAIGTWRLNAMHPGLYPIHKEASS